MTGRRVLVSSTYYWPETTGNAPYVTQLCEHLAARGDSVTVLSGFPHYPEWRGGGKGKLWRSEERNGVNIRRKWHYVPPKPTALHRAVYEASLACAGLTSVPTRKRPDAVIAILPTLASGMIAGAAATMYRAPLGLIFQDLLGQSAEQNGVKGGERVAAVVRRAELGLARRAAGIGVIANGFRDYLHGGGVSPDRVRLLRNWTHVAEPTESIDEARERLGWAPAEFICLHAGNMGQKQGLDNLVAAASVLQSRGNSSVRVVLAGNGNDRPRLESLAANLGNVSFLGLQPAGQYEATLRAADILIAHQRPSLTDAALPSKLTSYFAAARPVLAVASADSQTAREMQRAGAGPTVAPENPEALADALAALEARSGDLRVFGENAARYAADELGAGRALQEYEAFIDGMAGVAA